MKKIVFCILTITYLLMLNLNCFAKEWTQEEAVGMVKSWVGTGFNWDNGGNGWDCVDVPLRYYNEITDIKDTSIRGNANKYSENKIPNGWVRKFCYADNYKPQAGDVLVWTTDAGLINQIITETRTHYGSYEGHVAVAITNVNNGKITFVDQDSYTSRPCEIHTCDVREIYCCIIPPFNQNGTQSSQQSQPGINADEEINEPSSGWSQDSAKQLLKKWVDSSDKIDYNGINGYDEVDVLLRYIRHISGETFANRLINDFVSCELPNGWIRLTPNEYTAQTGDIVVWKGKTGPAATNDGHCGVVYEKNDSKIKIVDQDSTRQRAVQFNDYNYRGDMYFLVPPFNQSSAKVGVANENNAVSDTSTSDEVSIAYDDSLSSVNNSSSSNNSNSSSSSSNSNSSSSSSSSSRSSSSSSSYSSNSSSSSSGSRSSSSSRSSSDGSSTSRSSNGSSTFSNGPLANNASNSSSANSNIPKINASIEKATLGIDVIFQINPSQGAFNLIKMGSNTIVKDKIYILNTINVFTGQVSSSTYYFDKEGKMQIGWVQDANDIYYYFDDCTNMDRGKMVTGWKMIDGKYYFFKSDGKLLVNGTTPDGYKVGDDGTWQR